MMSGCGKAFSLLFLLILANVSSPNEASTVTQVNGSVSMEAKSEEMVPLMEEKMVMMLNETRRKLNSFQICALCTCCGGAKGLCIPSPCCYAINCNIPNRPFGFCSFTPKTCNCLGCHI
ncbi:Ubiquitin carboxyl-terminal hydrolase [Melia azedarach]|uniref:Ubiquitin carboxyl-terminal hydrolase n=1 Tax=Melia azedarach TaxID=155640 RepID=A0ACC1YDG9_MELAZ|nr:Ubiquitin carboxyl-terminal hydrolase [Melia azedarach]